MADDVRVLPDRCPRCGSDVLYWTTKYVGYDVRSVIRVEPGRVVVDIAPRSDEVSEELAYWFGCGSCEWDTEVRLDEVEVGNDTWPAVEAGDARPVR